MTPRELQECIARVRELYEKRAHRLSPFKLLKPHQWVSECTKCHEEIYINTDPGIVFPVGSRIGARECCESYVEPANHKFFFQV